MPLNPGMLDSPEWFEGLKAPQKTGYLDRPGVRPFLAQLGLGLIMGGMAQPYGRSRGQAMAPYFQRAVKGMFPSEDTKLKRRFLKGRVGEMESKAEKRKSRARSQRELLQWYRNQRDLAAAPRVGTPSGVVPQPQPWPPGPGGPQAGPSVPMGAPPSPAAGGVPRRGSSARIPPALLLGAFGDAALPYLERKGFTLSPAQRRYDPQGRLIASAPGIPKAPTSRSRIADGQTINEEFDRATNSWREIGRGPRWDPRTGGPTAAQRGNNNEIREARKRLEELEGKLTPGKTLAEELHLRMTQKTDTGRSAPDYNSYWGRTGWLAAQSLTGEDDPGQAYWSQRLMGVDARAQPSAAEGQGFAGSPEVGPALLPATDPGRSGALPPSAFAPPSAAPSRTPPPTERELRGRSAAEPEPDIGERLIIQGLPYEVLKVHPDGTLTILDLQTGELHRAAAELPR